MALIYGDWNLPELVAQDTPEEISALNDLATELGRFFSQAKAEFLPAWARMRALGGAPVAVFQRLGLVTLLLGGTLWVSQTLPPIVEPRPMVMRPEDGGAGVDHHVVFDDRDGAASPLCRLPVARRPESAWRPASRAW